jgi:ribosome-associated translation inhibitor RaiA
MIVSIVFRHGAENKCLRNWINSQSYELQKYTQKITRVQVVISRISHHKKYSSSVQCHISIHASGRKYIDIYEKNGSEGIAFNRAYDRVCSELSHQYSRKSFYRRDLKDIIIQSESYLNENSQLIS